MTKGIKNTFGTTLPPYSGISVRIQIPQTSLLLDTVSWCFNYFTLASAPSLTDVNDLLTKIGTSFSTVATGAVNSPSTYLNATANRNTAACTMEAYDISNHLDGTPHGSPIETQAFSLQSGATAAVMPEGCCCAITLKAPYGSDPEFGPIVPPEIGHSRPRSRDRGRIFFGPLGQSALAIEAGTNRTTISAGASTDLLKWVHAIASIVATSGTVWDLGVWSRVAAVIKAITEVQLDDRPDYQRRRADQGNVLHSLPVP